MTEEEGEQSVVSTSGGSKDDNNRYLHMPGELRDETFSGELERMMKVTQDSDLLMKKLREL